MARTRGGSASRWRARSGDRRGGCPRWCGRSAGGPCRTAWPTKHSRTFSRRYRTSRSSRWHWTPTSKPKSSRCSLARRRTEVAWPSPLFTPDAVERDSPEAAFGDYDLFVREKLDDRIEDEDPGCAARRDHFGPRPILGSRPRRDRSAHTCETSTLHHRDAGRGTTDERSDQHAPPRRVHDPAAPGGVHGRAAHPAHHRRRKAK